MCYVFVLQAWFVATSTNLWTSDMYDGSNPDKLYIKDVLSIITYKKSNINTQEHKLWRNINQHFLTTKYIMDKQKLAKET
jgi:hypothetical protein